MKMLQMLVPTYDHEIWEKLLSSEWENNEFLAQLRDLECYSWFGGKKDLAGKYPCLE